MDADRPTAAPASLAHLLEAAQSGAAGTNACERRQMARALVNRGPLLVADDEVGFVSVYFRCLAHACWLRRGWEDAQCITHLGVRACARPRREEERAGLGAREEVKWQKCGREVG